MKNIKGLLVFILTISLIGCFIGGGTHGSIKGYHYATTKDQLEKAVMTVIKNNKNIYRDTIKNYTIDITNGKHDTIIDDYYNDGKNYVTIKIKIADKENEYTFRYYGDEEYWKVSTSSEIFICYAYDKNGNGGSEGHNSFKFKQQLKKEFTNVFESEFVNKIDKVLNLTHSETE